MKTYTHIYRIKKKNDSNTGDFGRAWTMVHPSLQKQTIEVSFFRRQTCTQPYPNFTKIPSNTITCVISQPNPRTVVRLGSYGYTCAKLTRSSPPLQASTLPHLETRTNTVTRCEVWHSTVHPTRTSATTPRTYSDMHVFPQSKPAGFGDRIRRVTRWLWWTPPTRLLCVRYWLTAELTSQRWLISSAVNQYQTKVIFGGFVAWPPVLTRHPCNYRW